MSGTPSQRLPISLLFVSASLAPFMEDDLGLLRRHLAVRECIGHGIGPALRIIVSVARHDIVFCWFASVYAAIAVIVGRLFGVRSVIVVGGVDVAAEEELAYGLWRSRWKGCLVRYALRRADKVLVVDPSLKTDAIQLAKYDGRNIDYLPTGYDPQFWNVPAQKDLCVLTVAMVEDPGRLRVKGIDILIEAARLLPEIPFVLIGTDDNLLRPLNPPANLKVLPPRPRPELRVWYSKAQVYCQPSRREGLANSLCEAMLCECIPVATRAGGNPTAVGDSGVLVSTGNPVALAAGIREALAMSRETGRKARARVVALFPKEKREREVLRIIQQLTMPVTSPVARP